MTDGITALIALAGWSAFSVAIGVVFGWIARDAARGCSDRRHVGRLTAGILAGVAVIVGPPAFVLAAVLLQRLKVIPVPLAVLVYAGGCATLVVIVTAHCSDLRNRRRAGHCHACGHALDATTVRCPECGARSASSLLPDCE